VSAFRLEVSDREEPGHCGVIGGPVEIPVPSTWPQCAICSSRLISFIELVLPKPSPSPFLPGSRLQLFACRQHDDIAGTIYSEYNVFNHLSRNVQLPDQYWNVSDGHYLLRLLPPSVPTSTAGADGRLASRYLTAVESNAAAEDGFKLFGEPFWLQDPENHICSCGAPMKLVLQIPDGFGFTMASGAKEQPNSFSRSEYCIFLGNQLYLFACQAQCNIRALWPVLQN